MSYLAYIASLLLLFVSTNSFALNKRQKNKTPEIPTKIRSKIIDINRSSQEIKFIGDVIIEKGDSSMLADRMKIIYLEENSKENKEGVKIKKVIANDNVRIFSDEMVATSDSGYYDPEKEIFILEDNVIVNNGTSIANGDKFIYNVVTERGHFIGKQEEELISDVAKKNAKLQKKIKRRVTIVINDSDSAKKDAKERKEQINQEENGENIKR